MNVPRAVVDFYTNPTFDLLMRDIETQWDKENIALRAAGRGESELKFNHQTGVCDGIERVKQLIENHRTAALKTDDEP